MTRRFLNPRALLGQKPSLEQLTKSLADLYDSMSEFYSQQSGAYTTLATVAHETVETTSGSAQAIELSTNHKDGDLVTVIQNGAGAVTISTEGSETIVGSATYSLSGQYQCVTLVKRSNWFGVTDFGN